MDAEGIRYDLEQDELRATVTLDKPETLNALTVEMIDGLCDALAEAEADDDVRAVVVTGGGDKAFCTGYDLGDDDRPGEGADGGAAADDYLDRMEALTRHLRAVWRCNKPVIAAVDGYCLAGGSDLAMVSDIVIASEDAEFGYPGQRLAGHPPALTYPFFMGFHQAKELLLTGKMIDASRAAEMGIYNRVVPSGEALSSAYDEVDEITRVPGNGARILKHSINNVAENQGFSGTLKNSEFLDTLAHVTALGKEYTEVAAGADSMEERLEWMNEKRKGMRSMVDE